MQESPNLVLMGSGQNKLFNVKDSFPHWGSDFVPDVCQLKVMCTAALRGPRVAEFFSLIQLSPDWGTLWSLCCQFLWFEEFPFDQINNFLQKYIIHQFVALVLVDFAQNMLHNQTIKWSTMQINNEEGTGYSKILFFGYVWPEMWLA